MEILQTAVEKLCDLLWNFPMLVLLLGTHLYFTFKLGVIQKKIPLGIRLSLAGKQKGEGSVSPYEALSTALAATIGTGNIVGISAAIAVGGPGAVFWCWISGLLGMATCYAECFLAVKYRVRRADGTYVGGPMYILDKVLHHKRLAVVFSVCSILAAFAVGSSVQSHAIASAIRQQADISPHLIGMAAGLLAGTVIIGGAKKIGKFCTCLVPVMSVFYLGSCLVLIWMNRAFLPETLRAVIGSAFSARSFIGGVAGTAVMTGLRTGMAKGLFTNEAGMGSMPMSAAAACTDSPARQALVSMTGVFWDTTVMCAVSSIAILSGMVKDPAAYLGAAEDRLCFVAFSQLPGNGELLLSVSLVLFAFATIVGWSFYGECAAHYLGGERGTKLFQIAYMVFVYLGAVLSLELVWDLSDLCNAFMALPNLVCLWALRRGVEGFRKQRDG